MFFSKEFFEQIFNSIKFNSDSSKCISLKIVDCGGGRRDLFSFRTGILWGRKDVLAEVLWWWAAANDFKQ